MSPGTTALRTRVVTGAGELSVAEVMVTCPKAVPATASVGEVRVQFEDDHVLMVLLTDGGALRGTLVREDLPRDAPARVPARRFARIRGRTVAPGESAAAVFQQLLGSGRRRLVVVGADGRVLGLVCLNRRRTGFCTDEGVAARAADRQR